MDRLPDEMLLKVLNLLNMKALVSCRLVCKRFRFWVDQVRPTELAVTNCPLKAKMDWSFAPNEVFDRDVLAIGKLSTLFKATTFKLHRLRRLRVDGHILCSKVNSDPDSELDFYLNLRLLRRRVFGNLKHLELGYLNLGDRESFTLSLPGLQVLCIFNVCGIQPAFTLNLNMPRLETICYGCWSKHVHLVHPHTIRFLEISKNEPNFKLYANVKVFRSRYLTPIDRDVLRLHKFLNELHLIPKNSLDCYSHIKATMNHLLTEKQVLGRDDLKIFFSDQLLEVGRRFEDYQFDKTHPLFSNEILL